MTQNYDTRWDTKMITIRNCCRDPLQIAIERAKEDLEIAEQNLKYAESDFVKVALLEYEAKRLKLDALIRRAKKELTA